MAASQQALPAVFPDGVPLDTPMKAIAACIPAEILSGDGLDLLLMRARSLPSSALDTMFLLESSLDGTRPLCDFCLCVLPASRFGRYVVDFGRRHDAAAPEAGLGSYLSEVGRPGSFLSRWFRMAILEYDVTDSSTDSPGVFLEGHDEPQCAHPLVRRHHKREKLGNPGLLAAAVCAAAGWEEDVQERRFVELLFAALPQDGGCSHAGAFPSRKPRGLRLVFSMSLSACVDFLARLDWEDARAMDQFRCIVSEISSMMTHVSVACDVTAKGLSGRIGLEFFRNRNWSTATAREWHAFLEYMSVTGVCNPGKIAALKRWPPRQLIFSDWGVVAVLFGINHFKMVVEDGRVSFKSYVGGKLVLASASA